MAMLAPLPLRFVNELLRQLSRLPMSGRSDRLEAVKHTFVEYLNTKRPQRARRLFTDLFAPVLVTDTVLLRAKKPIPGAIQRVDASGLWFAFSRYAFPDLAARVQHSLDGLASDALLDEVFKTPEALALQREMSVEAVRFLGRLLAGGRQVNAFLEVLNKRRLTEARKVALFIDELAPLDARFLMFVRDYLKVADACVPYLQSHLPHPAGTPWSEIQAEREAANLLRLVDEMGETVLGGGCESELPLLAPLTTLNVGLQYGAAALYLREAGLVEDDNGYLVAALIGHFDACCATLIQVLSGALKLNERLPGASIKFTIRESEELDGVLHRLVLLMPALIVGGILENRTTEPAFHYIWEGLAHFFSEKLAVVAAQRVIIAISSRRSAALDHKDVVWLLRLIWNWHQLARTYDLSFGAFEKWRERLLEDVHLAVDQASRVEAGELIPERYHHLLRLNEIAMVFDGRISQHLSVASQNVAKMIAYGLETLSAETPPGDRVLISEFVAMARAERARSRHWQSEDMIYLLDLADQRGV